MSKPGKRFRAAAETVDNDKLYAIEEAVKLVKGAANSKFDETVEIAMNLGVDPRHADQMVRGVCQLPHGSGRKLQNISATLIGVRFVSGTGELVEWSLEQQPELIRAARVSLGNVSSGGSDRTRTRTGFTSSDPAPLTARAWIGPEPTRGPAACCCDGAARPPRRWSAESSSPPWRSRRGCR